MRHANAHERQVADHRERAVAHRHDAPVRGSLVGRGVHGEGVGWRRIAAEDLHIGGAGDGV